MLVKFLEKRTRKANFQYRH